MWRLKIAEGVDSPYLYSTNKYVGRQTWEFDPNYGTPELREEVEKARRDFWANRYQVKPSSDLLWRIQVSKLPSRHRHNHYVISCYFFFLATRLCVFTTDSIFSYSISILYFILRLYNYNIMLCI